MTKVTLLIVADSSTPELEQLLLLTIESAFASVATDASLDFMVLCAERNSNVREALTAQYGQNGLMMVAQSTQPFNYNGELNDLAKMALKEGQDGYLIFANSDLEFVGDCIPRMLGRMEKEEVLSASPYDPLVHGLQHLIVPDGSALFGYEVRYHFTGWCIFTHQSAIAAIGGLSEQVRFWYSDNIHADQLKKAFIDHTLFTDCICEHAGSKTLFMREKEEQQKLTLAEEECYNAARKSLGSVQTAVRRLERQERPTDAIMTFYALCLMFGNDVFSRHRQLLLRRILNAFMAIEPLSYATAIHLVEASRTYMGTDEHVTLWKSIKNLLPAESKTIARVIRWYLLFSSKK